MEKKEFFDKINECAKSHNMKCKEATRFGGWGMSVEYNFSIDGFQIDTRIESIFVKENGNGYNFWTKVWHNGRTRITGPGYTAYQFEEQRPRPLEKICEMFLKQLEDSARYYEPIRR